jgi:hypothetical protein
MTKWSSNVLFVALTLPVLKPTTRTRSPCAGTNAEAGGGPLSPPKQTALARFPSHGDRPTPAAAVSTSRVQCRRAVVKMSKLAVRDTAADQSDFARGVVRRAKRPRGNDARSRAEQSPHAIDLRHVERLDGPSSRAVSTADVVRASSCRSPAARRARSCARRRRRSRARVSPAPGPPLEPGRRNRVRRCRDVHSVFTDDVNRR